MLALPVSLVLFYRSDAGEMPQECWDIGCVHAHALQTNMGNYYYYAPKLEADSWHCTHTPTEHKEHFYSTYKHVFTLNLGKRRSRGPFSVCDEALKRALHHAGDKKKKAYRKMQRPKLIRALKYQMRVLQTTDQSKPRLYFFTCAPTVYTTNNVYLIAAW